MEINWQKVNVCTHLPTRRVDTPCGNYINKYGTSILYGCSLCIYDKVDGILLGL